MYLFQGVYYRQYSDQLLSTGEVTSVHVFLNILCLGSVSGVVHLYLISDPVDLLQLDQLSPAQCVQVNDITRISD